MGEAETWHLVRLPALTMLRALGRVLLEKTRTARNTANARDGVELAQQAVRGTGAMISCPNCKTTLFGPAYAPS